MKEKKKSFIKRLLEKKYDMRKMYIGIVALQTDVKTTPGVWQDKISWEYKKVNTEDFKFKLFDKGNFNYKHIPTNVEYQVSSKNTGNKIVVVRRSLHKFEQFMPELMEEIKEEQGSYYLTKEDVKSLEEAINIRLLETGLQENSGLK